MDPMQAEATEAAPGAAEEGLQRQGSVRRARQLLESGQRPETQAPPLPRVPRAPTAGNPAAHITQWPLPENPSRMPRLVPRPPRPFPPGPPPPRPRHPNDSPSSSIYSERSLPYFAPNPPRARHPPQSFSQPSPGYPPPRPAFRGPAPSPTSAAGLTSSISATTDDLNRQPSTSSVGTIPDFPIPQGPNPAYILPPRRPPRNDSAQNPRRATVTRKSSVSPIPEEALDPRMRGGSLASSGAFPSSWGSGPAESEILGAYLDDRSDNGHQSGPVPQDENATLVRQASLGKRGKPSLRTIQKSNPPSYAPPEQPEPPRAPLEPSPFPMAYKEDTKTQEHGGNATRFRDSSSSVSSDSSHEVDLEKAPVFLDVPQKGLDANQTANPSTEALEKEMEVLPSVGPNMSGRRPGGRRPPRLDMDAVRDAEARGSLTSLPDLIRRATKLASRLDHGRTASRTNLCDEGNQPKPPFAQRLRNSGTLSDILASFPTPAPGNSEGRSSWPVFFKRSNLRNIQSHDSLSPGGRNRRQRRCCGMSPFVFILVCVVILIIIALAVLLPVFLVAVPNENASDKSPCEKSTPCKNGGVSVSSGDNCSCVCANGYTGSQCTIEGDASCVTTEVNEKNATVGSELPRLLEDSQSTFGIPLDSFTLMALFSQNNVSCMTENALVSFQDVHSKSRRSIARSEPLNLEPMYNEPPSPPTTTEIPIPTLAPRSNAATMDGIVYDGSASTENIPTTTSSPTATETTPSESTSSSTPTSTSTSTPSPVSNKVVDFSRIAVLYIFQQTGALDAAMHSEEDIQSYLQDEYSSSKDKQFGMDLHRFGASSNFTVNFDRFTISMDNWTVGGNRE